MMLNPVAELQVEFPNDDPFTGPAKGLQQTHSLSSQLSVCSFSNSRFRQFGRPQPPRRIRENLMKKHRSSSGTRRQRRGSSSSKGSGYPGRPHVTTVGRPS